jgi:lysozyme
MDADTARRLAKKLEREEARKKQAYLDSKGLWTIGVGRLIDPRVAGSGLRDKEIDFLLANDIEEIDGELARTFPWYGTLDPARQCALCEMRFQLGLANLLGFSKMLGALRDQKWADAEYHALDSKWAKVDSPARARRVARQLATGEWQ